MTAIQHNAATTGSQTSLPSQVDTDPGVVPRTDDLVLEHLWLADAIARHFCGRGEDDQDLRQVARCALVESALRFDPGLGPFVPYASSTIKGVLKRHFRDHGWVVRPPREIQQIAVQISQQWSTVAQQHGGVPNDHDLAESLDQPVATIREARRASQGYQTVTLDALSSGEAGPATDDPGFERCEARVLVRQTWTQLTDPERNLLHMRFWERQSQSAIAARLGISQMQVSRLLARTLAKLREQLDNDARSVA